MPRAVLAAVVEYLPDTRLTNAELAVRYPEWSVDKIADKTGIHSRRIAADAEFSSDLAVAAGRRLFAEHGVAPAAIDFVLLVTQSPDYLVPTTAALVQHRLGIPTTAGALDVNLGCSGYVYGLALARGLVESGQAARLLLLTTDTWSRYLTHADRSVGTLFGDGAAASLVAAEGEGIAGGKIGATGFGTDGAGADKLRVSTSGLRGFAGVETSEHPTPTVTMDGPEIFAFTLRTVPAHVTQLLAKAGLTLDDIDLVVLHQANQFMLEHLRKRMKIPEEKFAIHLAETGNTISSTIPLVLAEWLRQGRIRPGMRVLLAGFGVGLSWGSVLLEY
jgi:3-oxoacyl-[acyl-carrier-protein] synthase-3